MTNNDDAAWGPPGESIPTRSPSTSSPVNPLATPHPFSPQAAVTGSPDVVARVGPEAATLAVGPVGANSTAAPGRVRRVVAVIAAIVLVSGGGYAALSAGSATDGADSPEEALELMLEAISADDYLAAAEYVLPSERETLIQAGMDVLDELVHLNVLADDLDLAALRGIELDFASMEIRGEIPRPGMAHLFVQRGVVTSSINVAEIPFGPVVTERVSDDLLLFTDHEVTAIDRIEAPIVAVEQGGRWYLSLWYSVAENVRIGEDLGLPDPGRRPASIGSETPAAAIERFFDELLHLDVQRMIGMLDPMEAAALYDYSPLFLDKATAGANGLLERLGEHEWVWELEELSLTPAVDGDNARVAIDTLGFAATNSAGHSLDVEFAADRVSVALRSADFWGEPFSVDYEIVGNCFSMFYEDRGSSGTEGACADELLDGLQSAALTLSLHRVDGRWYISPTRTITDLFLDVLLGSDAGSAGDMVDWVMQFAASESDDGVWWPGLLSPGFGAVDGVPNEFADPVASSVENTDLLAGDLDIGFAYDDNEGAELGWWTPVLDPRVERGIYASVATESGELALVVYELSEIPDDSVAEFLLSRAPTFHSAVEVPIYYLEAPSGDPVLLALDDARLVLVGTFGADAADMEAVLIAQFG